MSRVEEGQLFYMSLLFYVGFYLCVIVFFVFQVNIKQLIQSPQKVFLYKINVKGLLQTNIIYLRDYKKTNFNTAQNTMAVSKIENSNFFSKELFKKDDNGNFYRVSQPNTQSTVQKLKSYFSPSKESESLNIFSILNNITIPHLISKIIIAYLLDTNINANKDANIVSSILSEIQAWLINFIQNNDTKTNINNDQKTINEFKNIIKQEQKKIPEQLSKSIDNWYAQQQIFLDELLSRYQIQKRRHLIENISKFSKSQQIQLQDNKNVKGNNLFLRQEKQKEIKEKQYEKIDFNELKQERIMNDFQLERFKTQLIAFCFEIQIKTYDKNEIYLPKLSISKIKVNKKANKFQISQKYLQSLAQGLIENPLTMQKKLLSQLQQKLTVLKGKLCQNSLKEEKLNNLRVNYDYMFYLNPFRFQQNQEIAILIQYLKKKGHQKLAIFLQKNQKLFDISQGNILQKMSKKQKLLLNQKSLDQLVAIFNFLFFIYEVLTLNKLCIIQFFKKHIEQFQNFSFQQFHNSYNQVSYFKAYFIKQCLKNPCLLWKILKQAFLSKKQMYKNMIKKIQKQEKQNKILTKAWFKNQFILELKIVNKVFSQKNNEFLWYFSSLSLTSPNSIQPIFENKLQKKQNLLLIILFSYLSLIKQGALVQDHHIFIEMIQKNIDQLNDIQSNQQQKQLSSQEKKQIKDNSQIFEEIQQNLKKIKTGQKIDHNSLSSKNIIFLLKIFSILKRKVFHLDNFQSHFLHLKSKHQSSLKKNRKQLLAQDMVKFITNKFYLITLFIKKVFEQMKNQQLNDCIQKVDFLRMNITLQTFKNIQNATFNQLRGILNPFIQANEVDQLSGGRFQKLIKAMEKFAFQQSKYQKIIYLLLRESQTTMLSLRCLQNVRHMIEIMKSQASQFQQKSLELLLQYLQSDFKKSTNFSVIQSYSPQQKKQLKQYNTQISKTSQKL